MSVSKTSSSLIYRSHVLGNPDNIAVPLTGKLIHHEFHCLNMQPLHENGVSIDPSASLSINISGIGPDKYPGLLLPPPATYLVSIYDRSLTVPSQAACPSCRSSTAPSWPNLPRRPRVPSPRGLRPEPPLSSAPLLLLPVRSL